jgi:hypothetical protein
MTEAVEISPASPVINFPLEAEAPSPRMLYDRKSAAYALSISIRSLDYLIARKAINTRRIGRRSLIAHSELVRFSRQDHPEAIN